MTRRVVKQNTDHVGKSGSRRILWYVAAPMALAFASLWCTSHSCFSFSTGRRSSTTNLRDNCPRQSRLNALRKVTLRLLFFPLHQENELNDDIVFSDNNFLEILRGNAHALRGNRDTNHTRALTGSTRHAVITI